MEIDSETPSSHPRYYSKAKTYIMHIDTQQSEMVVRIIFCIANRRIEKQRILAIAIPANADVTNALSVIIQQNHFFAVKFTYCICFGADS